MARLKESIYRKFISHLENAIKENFHFESAWLSYVLLEDRLLSLLRQSGGTQDKKGHEIKMMGPKIEELKDRVKTNQILKGHLINGDLLDQLQTWKVKRNRLMHQMADESLTIEEIDESIQELADEGKTLVRSFSAAARRVKKYQNR